MSGVNDLKMTFQKDGEEQEVDLLEKVARTIWHSVKTPPKKEDCYYGDVLALTQSGRIRWTCAALIGPENKDLYRAWARVNDAILMPPQGGE